MKTLSTIFLSFTFFIQISAQISANINNYNCNNNGTFDVEITVTGAQPNIFTDLFSGYKVTSSNGNLVTDCYDVSLVSIPCICPTNFVPVCL
jgi:hypothetical protein